MKRATTKAHHALMDKKTISRREFELKLMTSAGGLLTFIALPSCRGRSSLQKKKTPLPQKTEAPEGRFSAETELSFPLFELKGKPFDIGFQIGKRFADDIRKGFILRARWWRELKEFADSRPPHIYETFLKAATKVAPEAVEELKGWAKGAEVEFRDLMILNLKAEYFAMKEEQDRKRAIKASYGAVHSGCSTICINDGYRIILAHNEDGDMAYLNHMFLLKVHPEGKPSFLCASYPGILPGNAPWINEKGIAMTTNFIYSRKVNMGVGRYFLDRKSMEAKNLQEAISICNHRERAYAFHHVIVSSPEQKAVSLEVIPSRSQITNIEGVFIHTNHLISPALSQEAQDLEYVKTSSMTRWNVLEKWTKSFPLPVQITEEKIVKALSSHDGRPYCPCRHPEGKVRGATLLTAVFNFREKKIRIYKNQPCLGLFKHYPFI